MPPKQKNLSHEEVWDDSALINSWNEALEEYKKYHSIHAKGGSVRDLEPKNQGTTALTEPLSEDSDEVVEDSYIKTEDPDAQVAVPSEQTNPPADAQPPAPPAPPGAFPVQAVLGSIRDENLKKLLMSWYYAGYYTGLFEGQQHGQQS